MKGLERTSLRNAGVFNFTPRGNVAGNKTLLAPPASTLR